MAQPRRPDQRPQAPVPYTPGSRSGSAVQTVNLDTSGLALDTTVAAVNATLASPAQQSTLTGLLSQIQNAGAQPFVPNMKSASKTLATPGASPYTIFTFTTSSRIWAVSISMGAATNNSYTGATTNLYSLVKTGGGVVLIVVELAIGGATAGSTPENGNNSNSLPIPGIPVSSGDKIILDVNNGAGITNLSMRTSCNVLYSTP